MANGANRLFDVIKQTGESTNGIASQVVSLTIKSVNPLILMRDDRLEIPAEFCILHKSLDINNFRINDIVTAIVLNNGQQYLILYNNTAEEQGANYNDLSNKPKINGVELKGNKTSDDLLIVSKSELQQVVAEMVDNINNKVTKSGDTMTGELLFVNKNIYNAIRKTRTFNNEDYQVSVGVGGNMCARMEYIKVPDNVLSSVEARSNGIYNGVSGKKLLEIKTKTITNANIGSFGNIDLGLNISNNMVLGVKLSNTAYASLPMIQNNYWFCYVIKNQAQTTLNLQTSGTVSATVYYVEY